MMNGKTGKLSTSFKSVFFPGNTPEMTSLFSLAENLIKKVPVEREYFPHADSGPKTVAVCSDNSPVVRLVPSGDNLRRSKAS